MMRTRILLVEDEVALASGLVQVLVEEGYDGRICDDGAAVVSIVGEWMPALVVLDVGLPGSDGFAVLAALRERWPRLPILMLTARSQPADKVRGLDGGADDYLTKPFGLDELLARIRALLRRHDSGDALLQWGADGLRVDVGAGQLTGPQRAVALGHLQCAVLRVLAEAGGQPVPREVLVERAWQGAPVTARAVDQAILGLRKKCQQAGAPDGKAIIATCHGIGYRLRFDS